MVVNVLAAWARVVQEWGKGGGILNLRNRPIRSTCLRPAHTWCREAWVTGSQGQCISRSHWAEDSSTL